MNLQYSSESGSALELEKAVSLPREKPGRPKRIPVKCRQRNRFIPVFLIGVAALSLASLLYLGIDWGKMASRIPDIGVVFWDLAHLDFSNMDLILSSLVETVSIAVLSLLYSLVLGVLFGGHAGVLHLSAGGAHPGLGAFDAGLSGHGARGRRGRALRPHDGVLYKVVCPEL